MINLIQRTFRLLRMAWIIRNIRKAKSEATQQAAKHALSEFLAGSRGLPMKIGQVLAGMDDDTPYTRLTTSVEPWTLKQIIPIIEDIWQHPLSNTLQNIEESHAAASLGQVHRAQLNNGETVAIKVQYPDIAHAIHAEMMLAGILPAAGPVKRWQFDMDAYKNTLKDTLDHELDYLHEMHQQQQFRDLIQVDGLHVPRLFLDFCRKKLLVQEWVEGVRLSEAATWPLPARLQIAKTLMTTMFQSLFEIGLIHGDPHPGNMLFQYDDTHPDSILLDFGCMVKIEKTRRQALLKLILASRGQCHVIPLDAFSALGFDTGKLIHIQKHLPQIMQILFRPFVEERPFDSDHWHLDHDVAELLGDQRWWFRSAGPADLFLIMRVFQGLVSQLNTLKVNLPWWPILKQSITEESIQTAAQWQPPTRHAHTPQINSGSAKQLYIDITIEGKSPIHLSLPANSALRLESFVPEHVYDQIHDAGICMTTLQQQFCDANLEPQTLINIKTDEYHYHLWLE